MFTFTFFDLECENSISIWEFEMMNILKNSFAFIKARYTIIIIEQNETVFINVL